ncbi:MAG: efflux RND transporter periplasmic adaptor subunit [Limisphaerales bacterium]
MKIRLVAPLVILLVLTGLIGTGCHRTPPSSAEAPQLPTATVEVQTLERQIRPAVEEAVGTIRAKVRASLEAKLSGRIERLGVVLGQRVKAGDVLVELDAREIQARLDQAKAMRQQVDRDLQRFQVLLKQEAVTQAEFDAVEARHRVATAAMSEVETMLSHVRILAPFDGVVTRKLAEVGDLAAPGRPLLELEDPATLRFEADVPEALIQRIQPDAKLPVRVASRDAAIEGTVVEMAPTADAISRTVRVKLDLPPADGVRAGQFGRLTVPLHDTSVIEVPSTALIQRGQMELVFVVTNQVAQLRLVKTGRRTGDRFEVLSGVSVGEAVVVAGAEALLDGQPVRTR